MTPAGKPPTTTPITTGTIRISADVATVRLARSGTRATVSTSMLPRAAAVPAAVRFSAAFLSQPASP